LTCSNLLLTELILNSLPLLLFSFQRTSSRYFLKAATKTILPHIFYVMQALF
jgi:hypothetical protein